MANWRIQLNKCNSSSTNVLVPTDPTRVSAFHSNSTEMTAPSLLNINVDNLFEQHSIAEIDQIHKKLQNDVEEKKEELRTMVG